MSAHIVIAATDGAGREVDRFVLSHGAAPVAALAARGWALSVLASADLGVGDPIDADAKRGAGGRPLAQLAPARTAVTEPGDPWTVTITYAVRPASPTEPREPEPLTRDDDLTDAEAANAEVYQRIAAYAFVSSYRGLLLTELSGATNAPGQWNLPGGGIDEGEGVEDALRREIWEETGQQVQETTLLGVLSSHWVGRAPRGRVEDYHAVRLIHGAICAEPTDPVVHDVGGSTSRALWVPWTEVGQVPLVGSFAPLIGEVTGRHLAGS